MAVRFLGIGRQKARLADQRKKLTGQFEDRTENVQRRLGDLTGLAEGAYGEAEQSVFDRFGSQIQSHTDRIGQNRASAQNAVLRALMAGGGDVTGGGAITLGEITEGANQAIGRTIQDYSNMNENIRQFQQRRGDQLTLSGLETEQGLMNMTLGQLMQNQQQDAMRRQANKQLFGDIIGTVGSVAGKLIGGGG